MRKPILLNSIAKDDTIAAYHTTTLQLLPFAMTVAKKITSPIRGACIITTPISAIEDVMEILC